MIAYKGTGAPTKETFGNIDDVYMDKLTGTKYMCTDVIVDGRNNQFITIHARKRHNVEHVWEEIKVPHKIKDFTKFCADNMRLDDIYHFDTSGGTTFHSMFHSSGEVTSIPNLDTSNGTDFSYMFYNCSSLTSIPNLDTSKGTNFSNMLRSCRSLTSIPYLDTSNGTDFSEMFYNCTGLTSIPNLDTSNGISFGNMFAYSSLTSIPYLDTSNGIGFGYMFSRCESLTSIPHLDVGNGQTFTDIFKNCYQLQNLRLYNIRKAITISYSSNLTVDSLVHIIKELCSVRSSAKLTIGSINIAKIAGLYCRVTDDTTEKIDMELCESTDPGAMTLEVYAGLKRWTLA